MLSTHDLVPRFSEKASFYSQGWPGDETWGAAGYSRVCGLAWTGADDDDGR